MSENTNAPKKDQEAAFKKACAEVRQHLVLAERNDVQARYEIGAIVLGVKDAAKYGENGVERMEEELRFDKNVLYRHARVAETWSPEAFEELTSRLKQEDQALSWSHLELLATVRDGRNRRGYITDTVTKCLSVRALRKVISDGQEKATKKPEDHATAIKHTKQLIGSIEMKVQAWEKQDLPKITTSINKLTEKDLSDLRDLRTRLDKILDRLSDRFEDVVPSAQGQALTRVLEPQNDVGDAATPTLETTDAV